MRLEGKLPTTIRQEFAIQDDFDAILALVAFDLFDVTFEIDSRHDTVTELQPHHTSRCKDKKREEGEEVWVCEQGWRFELECVNLTGLGA